MKMMNLFALALMSAFANGVNAQTPKDQSTTTKLEILKDTRKEIQTKENGDTTVYQRRRYCDISLAEKQAVRNGEMRMFNNRTEDVEGKRLRNPFVEISAGGHWITRASEIQPEFRLTAGSELKHWLWYVSGSMSWNKHNHDKADDATSDNGTLLNAVTKGYYSTWGITGGAAYKVWQNAYHTSSLAVYGEVGLHRYKTDGDDVDMSAGTGCKFEAGLQASINLGGNCSLTGKVGYGNVPKVYHDQTQDYGNLALFAQIGLRYTFRK
jgi:hypothetical protein